MSEPNWAGKTVPQMWASAQAADTQMAWQQVNAWRRTHDLLLHHAGRLKACADELSYAWPPGRSPAAQAFIEYITELHKAIMRASVEAATNYSAIAGILTSLSAAKADMAQLKEQWDSRGSGTVAAKTESSSSADSWQETLNARARSRMARNDQEVLESSRRLVDLAFPWEGPESNRENLGTGPEGRAGSGGFHGSQTSGGPFPSRIIAPTVDSVNTTGSEFGLAGSTIPPGSGGVGESLVPTASQDAIPATNPQISSPRFGAGGTMPALRAPSSGEPVRVGRPGGFSAGQSGLMSGVNSASPSAIGAARGPGRVNPIGGVIDANRPASPGAALPLMGGARGAAQDHRNLQAALTMFWDVPEGVASVIEPAPERPFELGPGVIGIDR